MPPLVSKDSCHAATWRDTTVPQPLPQPGAWLPMDAASPSNIVPLLHAALDRQDGDDNTDGHFARGAYAPIGRRNAVLQHNHRPRFLVAEDEAACKQMTVHLGWCFRKQLSVGQRGGRVKQQQPWSRKSLRKQFKFSTRPSGVAFHLSLPEHGDCIVTLLFQHGIRRWHAGGRTGRTRPAPPMTGSWLPLQLYKHLAQHPSARACSCTSQQSLTRSTG